MAAQPVAVAPRASLLRNRYAVFGVVMLVLLMGTMNVTLVLVAVLHIQQGLDTTLAWVSWTVTGHQLAQVATMPLAAKLGDQFGRKRVFLGAIVCFLAGSTGAGLAPNIGTLILFRVVMGFGVGAFMPSAAGIVADLFPRQRAKMIGLFSTFLPFGWVLGPNLGGFVVGNLSWRWAMLANAPIAIVAFAAMAAMLTESRRAAARHHFDVMGASLLAGGGHLVHAGVHAAGRALFHLVPVGAAAVRPQPRAAVAVLAPRGPLARADRRRRIAATAAVRRVQSLQLLSGAVKFGFSSIIPLFTVTVYGFSTQASGSVLTLQGLLMMAASTVTSLYLLQRLTYRPLIVAGSVLFAAIMLWMSFSSGAFSLFGLRVSDFWVLNCIMGISGIGLGISNPPSNNAGMELLPGKAAAITGMRGMFRVIGGVISGTVIYFILSTSADQERGLQIAFIGMASLIVVMVPLALMMPTGRERPLAGRDAEVAGGGVRR